MNFFSNMLGSRQSKESATNSSSGNGSQAGGDSRCAEHAEKELYLCWVASARVDCSLPGTDLMEKSPLVIP